MSFPASRFLISSARIERLTLIAVLLVQAVLCAMCPARVAKADSPGSCPSPFSKNFPGVLEFGMPAHEGVPGGWTGMPQGTVSLMPKAALHGHRIVQIDRTKDSPSKFSFISLCIPVDFTGKTITFRGFLSTGNVNGFAGLWLREDAGGSAIAFDNMQGKNLNGTTKWKDYAVTLPIKPQAEKVVFGVLLSGTGKVQSSNLRLLVDGKPI